MSDGSSATGDDCSGQSFVAALKKKFDEDDAPPLQSVILLRKTVSRKSKSGNLVIPQCLSLSNCSVTHAGEMSEVTQLLRNVSELDMSMNHLTQWHEVFNVILCLPNIHFLDLSRNPLYQSGDVIFALQLHERNAVADAIVVMSWKPTKDLHSAPLNVADGDKTSECEAQLSLPPSKDPCTSDAVVWTDELGSPDVTQLDVQSSDEAHLPHSSTESLDYSENPLQTTTALDSPLNVASTSGATNNETFESALFSTESSLCTPISDCVSSASEPIFNESSASLPKYMDNVLSTEPISNLAVSSGTPELPIPDPSNVAEILQSGDVKKSMKVESHTESVMELKDVDSREAELADENCCSGIESFGNITQLVLNATKVTWSTVQNILAVMTELKELHLSFNEYSTVDITTDVTYPKMLEVHFNGNHVASWAEMKHLGRLFPDLERLIMMDNPLTEFSEDEPSSEFKSLKALCLTRTLISSWTELERLKHFPCLTDVKLLGIPFFQELDEKLRRKLVVGFLPNITRLNGSAVSVSEREEAERVFIRHYMSTEEKPERYAELELKHGKLTPLADINLGASDLVTVTVQFNNKSILKQLSLHLTASELKRMLSREVVGVLPQNFTMFHNDIGSGFGPSVMIYAHRTLLTYRVRDGDEIICDLK